MSKKIISVLLAVVMVLAMGTVAMVSVSANIDSLPAVADGCYRYYFFMPDQWVNDYASTAGIYWWEGTDACASWPGYEATPTGYTTEGGSVYYYDVPTDVTTIIWNNYFDGGSDPTAEYYASAVQTANIGSEYYDVDESDNIPEGTDSFDGMIFMTDVDKISTEPFSGKQTFGGEWAYYYGNGEWGFSAVKGEKEVFDLPAIGWTPEWTVPKDTGAASDDETTAPTDPAATTAPVVTDPAATTAPAVTDPAATTAPVVTDPVVADQNIVLNDGVKYPYTTGDTVEYKVMLQADKLFENIQGTVSYDTTVLELQRVLSDDPDIQDFMVEGPAYCPNLNPGVVLNAADAGKVEFNASNISGYNFKENKSLITLTFKVIGEGDTTIDLDIAEMTKINGDSYFANGEQVTTEGIALAYTLTGNTEPVAPTEPPVVTDPTTAPVVTDPTTAPVVTDPTVAPPVVTDPTVAPVVTDPTDAPVVTDPTTTAPAATDGTSATDATNAPADAPNTGAAAYIYVVLAVLSVAACAVVVLRKKVNG